MRDVADDCKVHARNLECNTVHNLFSQPEWCSGTSRNITLDL